MTAGFYTSGVQILATSDEVYKRSTISTGTMLRVSTSEGAVESGVIGVLLCLLCHLFLLRASARWRVGS